MGEFGIHSRLHCGSNGYYYSGCFAVIIQGGVLPWRLKSIINIAGVRRARRRSTSAPPVWRGFLFAIIARRAAVGRTYRQQLIGAVFAMSLLALGRNGRSQAGAEASGLNSLMGWAYTTIEFTLFLWSIAVGLAYDGLAALLLLTSRAPPGAGPA